MFKPFALLLTAALAGQAELPTDIEPEPKGGPVEFQYLKYRLIGPAAGGRVSRSAGVPGDPLIYYAASAGGGVWKTTDGGVNWKPVFDDQPISSLGSIAIAASDPNVVYAGSGEANIRGNVAAGNGVYKSVDGGKIWKHVWKQEGQIGTMIVHPGNPDIAFAAVLGHAFGPNPERGVYRTTDGGKTWRQVLTRDPDTGASDVCFDPSNPNVLFAGLWQTRRRPWEYTSGGPGSGLYTSRDGGDTWKQLTGKGLPSGIWGKIGIAIAPSDSRRVYALIEAEQGGLFRSTDGGEHWELVNAGHYLRQRPWYFSTLTVDPSNPDVVWCPTVHMLKSLDGGKTFKQVHGLHHGDHHDVWIDPKNPKRMIDSNDGGVDISVNGGETWDAPPLPLCQFYHIACDNRTPYHVSGTMQDLGTASGPSNSLAGGGIPVGAWQGVGGGETGFTVPDPSDPHVVYAGEYGGYITRYDHRSRQARNISIYPTNPSGHGALDLRYRFQWTAPIMVSPHNPKVIYHAGNVLFRSSDGGRHWDAVSPDLTRNDKSKQKWSGGPITGDNTGVEYYGTIFAIAESPRQAGVLWAGSDDGLVHVSTDDGKHWSDVTKNIPGMPEWGTVSCIEASPFDAGTADVVVDAHKLDDTHPYLYRTGDYGKTWAKLSAGLPQDVYLHVVREDPRRKGLLYAGTERGVVFSTDGGAAWQELKLNLPTVAVPDLVVKGDDLVVGTNGRSVWVFDDLTPVRTMSPRVAARPVHAFPVQPAVRWRYHEEVDAPQQKQEGQNPPAGAVINYFLKNRPKSPISLEILDARGATVRTLSSIAEPDELPADDPDAPEKKPKKTVLTTHPGVNRVVWDLCYAGAVKIPGAKVDAGDPKEGPLVSPGEYTLKLTVGDQAVTGSVTVNLDPRLHLSPAELEEQRKFVLAVRNDISRLSGMVVQIRAVRNQLAGRDELLKDNPQAAPLVKSAQGLIGKLDALEARLHNPKAEITYDILAQRGGARLYSQLAFLYESARDSDGPPTQGMREVYDEERRELQELGRELSGLLTGDLAKLAETARRLGIPAVIVPSQADGSKATPAKAGR
ncbi:MAG TPA: hypothetical protein VG013_16310 [Gemmataceae bacterium]|nr:hypothetical protein [Gemmataceae bacterium]